MTQVIDASAVVAALVDDGPTGEWCVERVGEDSRAAPSLMPYEVANIVRRMEAYGEVDAATAAQAVVDMRRMSVDLVPFESLADRVWELRANLTVYDASYVALAEAVGGPLITLDRRLARSPGLGCEIRLPPELEAKG